MPRAKDLDHSKIIDRHAQLLSRTVQSLDESRKLRLPRNGYVLRVARGKLIVAPLMTGAKRGSEILSEKAQGLLPAGESAGP